MARGSATRQYGESRSTPSWRRPTPARTLRGARAWLLLGSAALVMAGSATAGESKPFFFIQLSDPQFGMAAQNADFQQETANFEFAIATANRLKPAFVIVTGDLVHKAEDQAAVDEYRRIAAKLDPAIPLYQLPGNHDVGNEPTAESIARYVARFGPDHYAFCSGTLQALVINSRLIRSPGGAPAQAAKHEAWLRSELAKPLPAGVRHRVVFQHDPWFTEQIDEPDRYDNLPRPERRRYLDLFRANGVSHVFAGHFHANRQGSYETIETVITGAIGKPLRGDVSGMRIVILRDGGIEHRFYHLGEIPNRIDLSVPLPASPAKAPRQAEARQ